MNNRIKDLRTALGLSREAFGESLGGSGSVIKNLEYEKTTPKPALINHICTVFGINPVWLNSGESEMLKQHTPSVFDENTSDNFKLMLIQSILSLDDNELQLLKKMLKNFTSILTEEQD